MRRDPGVAMCPGEPPGSQDPLSFRNERDAHPNGPQPAPRASAAGTKSDDTLRLPRSSPRPTAAAAPRTVPRRTRLTRASGPSRPAAPPRAFRLRPATGRAKENA